MLKIIGYNLLFLLVVTILAESIFGSWFASDPLDRLNLHRNARFSLSAAPLYPGGGEMVYRRDRWGFRGDIADPARITILTMGGSTTNQLYLPEDQTWQQVAVRALAASHPDLVIANAGIDGQSTIGHLFNLDNWFPNVPGLRPRFVLAYVGINDAQLQGSHTDTLAFSSFSKWLNHNSALLRLGRTLMGIEQANRRRLRHSPIDYANAQWTTRPAFADTRTALPGADPLAYAGRLRQMVDKIRAMGAQPLLMTQVRGDYRLEDGQIWGLVEESGMNGVDQWRLLNEFNRTTLAVCAETGATCLDLAAEVRFAPGDFYDRLHTAPQGSEKIGRWLAGKLAGLV